MMIQTSRTRLVSLWNSVSSIVTRTWEYLCSSVGVRVFVIIEFVFDFFRVIFLRYELAMWVIFFWPNSNMKVWNDQNNTTYASDANHRVEHRRSRVSRSIEFLLVFSINPHHVSTCIRVCISISMREWYNKHHARQDLHAAFYGPQKRYDATLSNRSESCSALSARTRRRWRREVKDVSEQWYHPRF